MFEEWPKDPAILKLFARHYKTNEPLPADLAQKARAADDFGRALGVRTQMFYAAISLDFYNRDPQGLDQDKLVAQLQDAIRRSSSWTAPTCRPLSTTSMATRRFTTPTCGRW